MDTNKNYACKILEKFDLNSEHYPYIPINLEIKPMRIISDIQKYFTIEHYSSTSRIYRELMLNHNKHYLIKIVNLSESFLRKEKLNKIKNGNIH